MSRCITGLISGTTRGTWYLTVSSRKMLVSEGGRTGGGRCDRHVPLARYVYKRRVVERDRLAEEFERARPRLRAVAYRMLGSLTEADDAVQEAWLRLDRTD